MGSDGEDGLKVRVWPAVLAACVYLVSGPSLIVTNKHLMKTNGFHFPMALASVGLWSSFGITLFGVHVLKVSKPTIGMSRQFFLFKVLPIGLAQASTFKFGMQSYLFLSVAFIQMMKAFSPATTMTGLALLGKMPLPREAMAVLVICIGTTFAAYGEINLTMMGLFCVVMAEVSECIRLIMTQLLLTDHKFHIVDALLFITPAGALWLTLGSMVFEWPAMAEENAVGIVYTNAQKFAAAGILGFIVNTAGYLVIQTSGAVMLKVLGTARNGGFVIFCGVFLGEVITANTAAGYTLSLSAFCCYTYIQLTKNATPAADATKSAVQSTGLSIRERSPQDSKA